MSCVWPIQNHIIVPSIIFFIFDIFISKRNLGATICISFIFEIRRNLKLPSHPLCFSLNTSSPELIWSSACSNEFLTPSSRLNQPGISLHYHKYIFAQWELINSFRIMNTSNPSFVSRHGTDFILLPFMWHEISNGGSVNHR